MVDVPTSAQEGREGGRGGAARLAGEGAVHLAVEEGRDPEQGLVEDGHHGPDLVERVRPLLAELGRPPEQRHLLAQAVL